MNCRLPDGLEKEEKPKRVIDTMAYSEMMFIALSRITDFPYMTKKQMNDNFDKYWNLYEKNKEIDNDDSDAVIVKESKVYNSVLKELKNTIKKFDK